MKDALSSTCATPGGRRILKNGLGMGDEAGNDRPAWRHDDDGRLSPLGIDDWRPVADDEPETAIDEEEDERDDFADDLPSGPSVPPDATDATLVDANVAPENVVMEGMCGESEEGMATPTILTTDEIVPGLPSLPSVHAHPEKST